MLGMHGAAAATVLELECSFDLYDGVIVDADALPTSSEGFAVRLTASLASWREAKRRGVWLKIPTSKAALVETAAQAGFEFHHAERAQGAVSGYVMMTHWLCSSPCTLPANASHQVGVGALVLNEADEVLLVQERRGPAARPGFWKMPTGLVDVGEAVGAAAVREVAEETGVTAKLESVVSFREVHGVGMAGKSDLFFVCACRALSTDICIQESEIAAAKWMPLDEYFRLDYMSSDSLYFKMAEWGVQSLRGKYTGLIGEELPVGFRPGHNMVYHTSGSLATSKQRPAL